MADRCSICGSEYEPANDARVPTNHARRTLHCGHSFCYPCLKTCVLEGRIYCNLCETTCLEEELTLQLVFFLKLLNGQTEVLRFYPDDTIADLHQRVNSQFYRSLVVDGHYSYRLIYAGRQMEPTARTTLRDYGLINLTTVHSMAILRGD